MKQITWRRIDGTLTPMYREAMGPWLRCDQHAAYQRSEYELTPGMAVWANLLKQGYQVLEVSE